jgi:hypothetical protein
MNSLAMALLLVVGCYAPRLSEGGFSCPGGSCPSGQTCFSGQCYRHEPPRADGGPAETGQPDLPPIKRAVGEPCLGMSVGGIQTDDCVAGATCVSGNVQSICLATCANDQGCSAGVSCENRNGMSVCGLPAATCDPLTPVAATGCPSGRICYLEDTRTICEIASGEGQRVPCLYSRECLPGFTCATVGPGVGRCQQVCSPASICSGRSSCMLTSGQLGYCF